MVDDKTKKLILLYGLNELNTKVKRDHFAPVIVENTPLNWIDYTNTLTELTSLGLVSNENNLLGITNTGLDVLNTFIHEIPQSAQDHISIYIQNNKDTIIGDISVQAHLKRIEDYYEVTLSIVENDLSLMELKLMTLQRQEAEDICKNFKKSPEEVYGIILNMLSYQ